MYPYAEGLWAARNQWYVAGWADEVTQEPMERWLLNEPVVLYRKENGEPVALHGRCPHRQFPLVKANRVGDSLECSYHGFVFDETGACTKIPTQKKVPASCKIPSYPIVQKWNWLWIWMGDPEKADESMIPDHEVVKLTDPDWLAVQAFTLFIKGRHQLIHDNLSDLSHLTYIHPGIIGVDDVAETEFEVMGSDNWFRDERSMHNQDPTGFFADILNYDKPIDRDMSMEFNLPCLHMAAEKFMIASSSETDPRKEIGSYRVHHAVTPATLYETHYFVAYSRNFRKDEDEVTQTINAAFAAVIDQDIVAIEALEEMLQKSDGETFKDFLAVGDKTSVKCKRAMEAMIRAEH